MTRPYVEVRLCLAPCDAACMGGLPYFLDSVSLLEKWCRAGLPVWTSLLPGPAALLMARSDDRQSGSYGRGYGAWGFLGGKGHGSVLKMTQSPVAFSWIRPGSPR